MINYIFTCQLTVLKPFPRRRIRENACSLPLCDLSKVKGKGKDGD